MEPKDKEVEDSTGRREGEVITNQSSVIEVYEWAIPIIGRELAENLKKNLIDGSVLFTLDFNAFKACEIPVGPAAKIINALKLVQQPVAQQVVHFPHQFCTIERINNTTLYWFKEKQLKYSSGDFAQHIPVFIDIQNDLTNVYEFIKETSENNAMTFFCPPGVGKTTICRYAAAVAHTIYIRIPANKTIMNSIQATMNQINFAMPANCLIVLLHIISIKGFTRILELAYQRILTTGEYSILEIDENGFCYEIPAAVEKLDDRTLHKLEALKLEALNTLEEVKKRLNRLTNMKFIFHFDELQKWAIPIKKFRRRKGREIVEPNQLSYYHLGCFAESVQLQCGPSFCKFFFSGTLNKLETYLDFGSALKKSSRKIYLADLTPDLVRYILHLFGITNGIDNICEKLAGPGRFLQYFLLFYFGDNNPSPSKFDKYIRDSLEKGFAILQSESKEYDVPSSIWDMIVSLISNVDTFGGEKTAQGYEFCKKLLSKSWVKWSSSGLFPVTVTKSFVIFHFLTYPYIWYAFQKVRNFSEADREFLISTQITAKRGPFTNIRYTFATALALELLVPNSILYRAIQHTHSQAVPIPKISREFIYCASEKDMKVVPFDRIGVARDNRSEGTKYGDIAFSLENEGEVYHCRIEAKLRGYYSENDATYSNLLGLCLDFFDQKQNYPYVKLAKIFGLGKQQNSRL